VAQAIKEWHIVFVTENILSTSARNVSKSPASHNMTSGQHQGDPPQEFNNEITSL